MSLVDPVTGELAAAEVVQAAALDYVMLADAIAERDAEQAADRKRLGALGEELRMVLQPGEAVDAGPATVVRTPAPRPAQRVSRSGCQAHAEELHGLGLGRWEYAPPGIAEVRRNAARIIAAGIDLERIAPTPAPAPDTLQIVIKDEGS